MGTLISVLRPTAARVTWPSGRHASRASHCGRGRWLRNRCRADFQTSQPAGPQLGALSSAGSSVSCLGAHFWSWPRRQPKPVWWVQPDRGSANVMSQLDPTTETRSLVAVDGAASSGRRTRSRQSSRCAHDHAGTGRGPHRRPGAGAPRLHRLRIPVRHLPDHRSPHLEPLWVVSHASHASPRCTA